MTEQHNSSDEQDWGIILDQLEAGRQGAGSLDEEQSKKLQELRTLVAETAHALEIYAQLDIDKGWIELRALAQQKNLILTEQVAVRRIRSWVWSYIAAASLVIVLGIGGYFYTQKAIKNDRVTMSRPDIPPGGNRATLVLSGGETISLSEKQDGLVVGKEGITYADGTSIVTSNAIQTVTIITPRAGQYQVLLPDGSKVWLNAASTLKYPTQFTGNVRCVELEGEAYFDVKKQGVWDKEHKKLNRTPFVVGTSGQEIEVLGTQFNVSAYSDDKATKTTLVKGSVRVTRQGEVGARAVRSVLLSPGQQSTAQGESLFVKAVDVQQYIAWKDGVIVLDEQNLQAIIAQLERWYDVEFESTGLLRNKMTLSGEIPRNVSLTTLLDVLGEQMNLRFEIKGRRVMVRN